MNKKIIATLVMSSLVASAFAVNAGAANDKQVLKDEKGAVHNVVGKLGKASGATAEERALNALDKVKGDFGFAKAEGTFKVKKSEKSASGETHTRMDQVVDGIKVFGGEFIVHEANGEITGVTGNFVDVAPKANKAEITDAAAIEAAIASTGYTGELTTPATAELGYLADGTLAYNVKVNYLGENPANWNIMVNAVDGSIESALNEVKHATGISPRGYSRNINTTYKSGTYYLEDNTHYALIRTRDMRNGTSYIYNMTDSNNYWDSSTQAAGVDAHYHADIVYEWYYNNVGRNSIDGRGMTMENLVRYSSNYANAFWSNPYMVYGDGNSSYYPFSVALDVVAHELTHGVTEYTSGLVYSYQSGALNESWSDAFGATIDGNDWLMGEDLGRGFNGAIRSLSNPNSYGDPDHMNEYVNTSSDNGGVHTNSGIPNKAFYNFATSIGSRTIAAKVWYDAQYRMSSNTNFSGARAATLQACASLYGTGSYYNALANAWSAVGVY